MLLKRKLILLIVTTIVTLPLLAQVSNLRKKKISASGMVKLDSLSVIPHSVFIVNYDTSYFAVDAVNAVLSWKKLYIPTALKYVTAFFPPA